MPTIQSLGLSGLPLDTLLTSLRENENQVLSSIQNREREAEARLSAYGKLREAVASFQTAAGAASQVDVFGKIAASVSTEAFSATADASATPGQFRVRVDQLASEQTLAYSGRSSRSDPIGSGGTLTLTTQDGQIRTLTLADTATSLDGLVAAINADPDIGVDATLVNDGSDQPWRLMLTSRETGTQAAAARIEVTGNNDLDAFLAYDAEAPDPAVTEQAARNALLNINGVDITNASNTLDDVIDGVTLTLRKTTAGGAESLTLTRDDGAAKKAIQGFVSAYNSLLTTVRGLTAYDMDTQTAAALTGDSTARMIQTRMRDAITSALGSGGNLTLTDLGISTDPKSGELKLDEARLATALAETPEAVKSLFSDATGIGARVKTASDAFLRTDGLFATATDGLNRTIADIRQQFQVTSDRIDQRMETYRRQFTQLDAMVSQMNSLSNYLTQQLSALNEPSNSR